ncbi:MAG TPA: type VI secretion system tube protein Hcp [Solirubrobacteraceae bacterium]|nr:type VI secretion system tube protein Hcp [Solirubrobacteraceae bacterium]
MAADYFLQITGIAGESTDAKHKGWIDVEAWSWGEANPVQIGTGSGGGAGKVQMQDFNFTTRVSKASPALFLACATGQHMKEARLAAVKAGAMQQEFLTWTFSDVLVTGYQTSGAGGDLVHDAVSLAFSKVKVEYKAQKADGSLDSAITAGWDAKANKKV